MDLEAHMELESAYWPLRNAVTYEYGGAGDIQTIETVGMTSNSQNSTCHKYLEGSHFQRKLAAKLLASM